MPPSLRDRHADLNRCAKINSGSGGRRLTVGSGDGEEKRQLVQRAQKRIGFVFLAQASAALVDGPVGSLGSVDWKEQPIESDDVREAA